MLDRLLLLFALTVLTMAVVPVVRSWSARRTGRFQVATTSPLWESLGERTDGRPAIVLFSTSSCGVCRTAQIPALELVRHMLGDPSLRIFKVDAPTRPDLVKAFHVLTAPTTVVFTGTGRVGAYNHGFATAERLIQQTMAASTVAVSGER